MTRVVILSVTTEEKVMSSIMYTNDRILCLAKIFFVFWQFTLDWAYLWIYADQGKDLEEFFQSTAGIYIWLL